MAEKFKLPKVGTYDLDRKDKLQDPFKSKLSQREQLTPEEQTQKQLAVKEFKIETVTGKEPDYRNAFAKALNLKKDTPWTGNPFWWPFHLINRPLQAVLHLINGARTGENVITSFFSGLSGVEKDIAPTDAFGIDTKNWSGAGKLFANLGLSLVLDPVSWLTIGGATLAKAGFKGSAESIQTAQAYAAILNKQEVPKSVLQSLGVTAKEIKAGAEAFKLRNLEVLSKSEGLLSLADITKLVIRQEGAVVPSTALRLGESLATANTKAFKIGFGFIRLPFKAGKLALSKLAPHLPKSVTARGANFVAGVNNMIRKLGFNFKFGYKTPAATNERFATLMGDKKRILQESTRMAQDYNDSMTAVTKVYHNIFNKKAVPQKMLDKTGKTLQEITEEANLFFKANSKAIPLDIGIDDLRGLLDDQVNVQLGKRIQESQNGFFVLEQLDNTGFKVMANEKHAKLTAGWLNNSLPKNKLVAETYKIASIDENLLKQLGLGVDEFHNILAKQNNKGWVVLLREIKGKKIYPVQLVMDQTGRTRLQSQGVRKYVNDLMQGKIAMQDDAFYQKLLVETYKKSQIKGLDQRYQQAMNKFYNTQYEKRIVSPEWQNFQDEIGEKVQGTIDDIQFGRNNLLRQQIDELQSTSVKLKNAFLNFRKTKSIDHLKTFVDVAKKWNNFYLSAQGSQKAQALIAKTKIKFINEKALKEASEVILKATAKSPKYAQKLIDRFVLKAQKEHLSKLQKGFIDKLKKFYNLDKGIIKIEDLPPYFKNKWRKINAPKTLTSFKKTNQTFLDDLKDYKAFLLDRSKVGTQGFKLTKTASKRIIRDEYKQGIVNKMVKTIDAQIRTVQKSILKFQNIKKSLNNEVKRIGSIKQIMTKMIKKGVDPNDLAKTIVGKTMRGIKVKFNKEEVNLALQGLKKYVDEDTFARINGNFNTRSKKFLNDKFQEYLKLEAKENRLALRGIQGDTNAEYLKTYIQALPKKTLSGLQFSKSPSYDTFEKLIDLNERHRASLYASIEEWHQFNPEWKALGYRPLVPFGEVSEQAMLFENTRKVLGLDSVYMDEWLPSIAYTKAPDNLKVMMTFHRKYLDNGEFLNSLVGTKLFNTTPISMYTQYMRNVDDLLTKPAIGVEAFGNNWVRTVAPKDQLGLKLGAIDNEGFIVMSGNKAAKLFEPMERTLSKNPQFFGRYKEGSEQAVHFAKNFQNLQNELGDPNIIKQLTDADVLKAIKNIQKSEINLNQATPDQLRNLSVLQIINKQWKY